MRDSLLSLSLSLSLSFFLSIGHMHRLLRTTILTHFHTPSLHTSTYMQGREYTNTLTPTNTHTHFTHTHISTHMLQHRCNNTHPYAHRLLVAIQKVTDTLTHSYTHSSTHSHSHSPTYSNTHTNTNMHTLSFSLTRF